MRKLLLICLILICSCKSHEIILSDFEKRLYDNQKVKTLSISKADSFDDEINHIFCNSTILIDQKMYDTYVIKITKNDKTVQHGVFDIWDREENSERKKLYYPDRTKEFYKKNNINKEEFFKKGVNDFKESPWHLLISKKTAHKYNKCVIEEKYGYIWYIFTGQIVLKDESPNFTDPPDNLVLFEIWIREDKETWMEFYRNSRNEIKIAVEGTFLVQEDELKFQEPRNLNELQKSFDKSFKKSLFYNMKILKDSDLDKDLY